MVANKESVMKFLVAEKCKPCEIYRRMCDVYDEACFSHENVYSWARHGFEQRSVIKFLVTEK